MPVTNNSQSPTLTLFFTDLQTHIEHHYMNIYFAHKTYQPKQKSWCLNQHTCTAPNLSILRKGNRHTPKCSCHTSCCSVTKLGLILRNPMDCSMPGFPVLCCLLLLRLKSIESVMRIQPSYPLLSPSLPAFHLSHHQGLMQWVSSSHQVTKILELQLVTSPAVISDFFPSPFISINTATRTCLNLFTSLHLHYCHPRPNHWLLHVNDCKICLLISLLLL